MNIYRQHESAFSNVSAGVIVDATGNHVGNVSIKWPRDGAGRLYLYLHIIGFEMVRGFAGGYGYDKAGAAFESAARALYKDADCLAANPFIRNWQDIGGANYQDAIRAAGLQYYSAV